MKGAEMDKHQQFSDILHKLNQPLTAINNYALAGSALLASGQYDPGRLRELFDKIADQTARSVDISREMREFGAQSFPADNQAL